MPLISIIIPCYNAEQYVDRCLQSITKQTIGIDNLEVICVNDGSTDRTFEKLTAWENRFPESIIVISYNQNLRQGTAKNIALKQASADYIGFVDIDDWIEENMYELLYEKNTDGHYDIVCGKYILDNGTEHLSVNEKPRLDEFYECEKRGNFYFHPPKGKGNNGSNGFMTTGIYKKSIFFDNDIFFPENLSYEDNYLGSLYTYYAKNTYVVDQIVYHYFPNSVSTTNAQNSPRHFDRLVIEMMKLEAYKQRGIFADFHDEIEADFVQLFWLNTLFIFFTRFDYIPDVVNDMRAIVLKNFPDFKKNPRIKENYICNLVLLGALDAPVEKFSDLDWMVIRTSFLASWRAMNNYD
jgi:glycosyltransferase involved in cell wall biosynthesis